ncbi:MAG TPA: hypothetical protein VJK48_04880 [Chlamydiales bacterium]|nr:hypothetical protein [Chlamydiales bacterium]
MRLLGIQLDGPLLRAAAVEVTRRHGTKILALRTANISDAAVVKQLYTDSKGRIGSGLSCREFIIRIVELTIKKGPLVEQALALQAESVHYFPQEEVLTVPVLQRKNSKALLFTARKEAIKAHLSEFEKIQIEPDGISSVCSALCSFVQWKIPSLQSVFIVDLGTTEWTCVWMQNGSPFKSHSIPGGVDSLLNAFWEDRKKILLHKEIEGAARQVDLLQLKAHLNPSLTNKLHELRQKLAQIIHSFQREADLQPLLFTGRTDALCHLSEFLIENVRDAICSECKGALTPEDQKFAVSIGLALERAKPGSLQFRRGEFFPQKNWKKLGIYSLFLLFFSLAISSALFIGGIKSTGARKAKMLQSLHSSLEKWDPSIKKKIFTGTDDEIISRWAAAIDAHSKEYPYIPKSPRVAESLNWLTAHPLLSQFREQGDPIHIQEIRYQLLKFPKIGASKEPYQSKMEIEFQFKEPIHARQFHEALLKGDQYVDPHQQVDWEVLANGYKTAFYLRNQSQYVF